MSEWITWEACPCCGGMAAVGWSDGEIVEFDCVRQCNLTSEQVAGLRLDATRPS